MIKPRKEESRADKRTREKGRSGKRWGKDKYT